VVYERFSLFGLGLGCLGRAALRLELERWYVGTAVPEDGVGGLPGVVEQLDVGAAATKALCVECVKTLCRVGDEVVSMLSSASCGAALLGGWLLHLSRSITCLLLP
jgi:hypothetical protein